MVRCVNFSVLAFDYSYWFQPWQQPTLLELGLTKGRTDSSAETIEEMIVSPNSQLEQVSATRRCFSVVLSDTPTPKLLSFLNRVNLEFITLRDLLECHVVQKNDLDKPIAVKIETFFIGVIAVTGSGRSMLNGHQGSLELFFGERDCDILDLPVGGDCEARLFEWTSQRMISLAEGLLRDAWSMRQALSVLRQEHEEAVERFAELEQAVSNFATPKRLEKLHFQPSQSTLRLTKRVGEETVAGRVRQVLPTSLYGLAVVEIHVAARPRGDHGSLNVTLMRGYSNVPIHAWSIPAKIVQRGWLTLRLNRAQTLREQDASIVVSWTGEGEQDGLALTLSDPNPLREYCAIVEGGYRANAPLALRVLGMVPGMKVVANGASQPLDVAQKDAVEEPLVFALASDELRCVKQLNPDAETEWKMVDFRESEMDILVHPSNDKATYAVVRNVGLAGVQSLSALVLLDHKDANAVEFGLAIVPHRPVHAAPENYIRHWRAAAPQAFVEVEGSVEGAAGLQNDLILATRMKDGLDARVAWARFKRIEVGF